MKKFVIFDLDGTLVDSIYDLADCVNLSLRKFSLPENTLEEYYSFVGNGMESLVRKSMKERSADDDLYLKVRKEFDKLYKEHCNDKTIPYCGVPDFLQKLQNTGVKTAVLTNKADEFVGGILRKCFPEHTFSFAWGNREEFERKPDPQALLAMVKEAGFEVADCVYVGDSEVDVNTAHNAGMALVCVGWGFRSEAELRASGADVIVSDCDELFKEITSL